MGDDDSAEQIKREQAAARADALIKAQEASRAAQKLADEQARRLGQQQQGQ